VLGKMPQSAIHGKSIRKNQQGYQPGYYLRPVKFRYFRGVGSYAKTNSPNAAGTWKLGAGVRVALQAE
jgi:hypothetical protein